MNLSETLNKIRNYTRENLELQKCHHFLFNLPLDKTSIKADVLVIGLNPGEGPFDWDYVNTPNTPTEETHEFDFHEEFGKGRSSIGWSKDCKKYLPDSKIFQSEFFFWSSPQVGEDGKKEKFSERFGYKFKDCPHFDFCKECNLELIRFHKPKLIVATGTTHVDDLSKKYDLRHKKTLRCESQEKHREIIHHYEWEDIPFIFTPHWSMARLYKEEISEIKSYLSNFT